jgi:hypothetical protein
MTVYVANCQEWKAPGDSAFETPYEVYSYVNMGAEVIDVQVQYLGAEWKGEKYFCQVRNYTFKYRGKLYTRSIKTLWYDQSGGPLVKIKPFNGEKANIGYVSKELMETYLKCNPFEAYYDINWVDKANNNSFKYPEENY